MGRVEELINGFAGVFKAKVTELEPSKYKKNFDLESPSLGTGQEILLTAATRQSGTIDFEFFFKIGQVTSPECFLDLLKMNFYGVYANNYIGIYDSDDPPCYFLYLKSAFTVSESTPSKEAIDIFCGDIISSRMKPVKWPKGVLIWSDKVEEADS